MTIAERRARFTAADRPRFERAVQHYLRHCYRLKTAARASELAAHLGLSPAYLSRIAPLIVGRSVREYLREEQLAYAVQLLRTTPLGMAEVAVASAFGTVSTFYRRFVEAFGHTPAEHREQFLRRRRGATLRLPTAAAHPERRVPFSLTEPPGKG